MVRDNIKWTSLLMILGAVLFTSGCDEYDDQTPNYRIEKQALTIIVPATGELEAAESQSIASPGQQSMIVAWLAEEFRKVKKGELIAVFDGEQISLERRKEELAMMLIEKDIRQRLGEKEQRESEVSSEKTLVSQEFDFAKSFNIDDLRIYSKLEIIDSMQNTEFLEAKDTFLSWKKQSVSEQSQSSVDVLDIRKEGHAKKLKQHEDALYQLEVRAPYDGLLVYQQNWRGEKPSVGQSVFPGDTIARIPNLTKMQAKLFVLDKEAIGLAIGQTVTLALDAFPAQSFTGKVKQVAAFSRTIQRGDPTKYFELIVELDNSDNPNFIPGRKLTAKINVDEQAETLSVPLQAIDNEDGNNFVYLKSGTQYNKQIVQTGKKNLHFVEITSGLSDGDVIALSVPEEQNNG